jgi:hypothetical protein
MAMTGAFTATGSARAGYGGVGSQAPWQPSLAAICQGSLAVILALAGLALVLVPQRIAQRPGRAGVIVVHLERRGGLRLWNQPIREDTLFPLLQRASRDRRPLRLRLVCDPEVPWSRVQAIADQAQVLPFPLELQLP